MAGGVYPSKPRPALIIQDDLFDMTESVTVLPLTTSRVDAPLLRVTIGPTKQSGLTRDSDVMVDKLTTVRRANVLARVGRLTSEQLASVERAMMVFLGLAG